MKVIVAGDIPESDMPEWIEWGFNLETAHAINLGITDYRHITLDVRIGACKCEAPSDTEQSGIT